MTTKKNANTTNDLDKELQTAKAVMSALIEGKKVTGAWFKGAPAKARLTFAGLLLDYAASELYIQSKKDCYHVRKALEGLNGGKAFTLSQVGDRALGVNFSTNLEKKADGVLKAPSSDHASSETDVSDIDYLSAESFIKD